MSDCPNMLRFASSLSSLGKGISMARQRTRTNFNPRRLWWVGLMLWLAPAPAEEIILVKSQSSSPYIAQAIEGFQSVCREPVAVVDLRGRVERKDELLKVVRQARPSLLVAFGPQAAEAARNTDDLPLLFVMVANPQKRGLHGPSIGGISLNIPPFVQFMNYTNLLPGLKRIGVIYDERNTSDLIAEARQAATAVGIELVGEVVQSERDVAKAFKSLLSQKIDALWMVPDEKVVTPDSFSFLKRETAKNKLPFLATSEIFVDQGALASLSVDYGDLGRQAGQIANELLKDKQLIARLDTQPPAKVNLTVNLETARQLGSDVVNETALKTAAKTYNR